MKSTGVPPAAALAAAVRAQVAVYGQCGGNGYSGSTACASGSYCSKVNDCVCKCWFILSEFGEDIQWLPANPMAGKSFYANSYYASEISSLAVPSMSAAGSAAWATKATEVVKIGTFVDARAKVPSIETYAADVQRQNAAGANLVLSLVYINSIVAQINAYPSVQFKLAIGESAYKTLVTYAIEKLNLPNVAMYLDAGHAGWLGWTGNITQAAQLFGTLYAKAGKPAAVRGLATNVANYDAWSISTCPSYASGHSNCDEKRYINTLAPLLTTNGFLARFIMDTCMSPMDHTIQNQWGDWCNVIGTGFGIRPASSTDDSLLDAWVWVKPGGECGGTSNSSSARYDAHCGYPLIRWRLWSMWSVDALQPVPEARTWCKAYFEQLLVNANPAFQSKNA
ncbi:glycoside hydrolase family 6 protein [Cenococcum geophilum]